MYEIIAGHRRKYAAQHLGFRKMPVIIRVLRDDDAVINMVDNAVKRGKSWHFMPMLQKIFVCYPGMCRVRVMEKKYEQKSVSLLSGYVQKMIAELT